jgi:hypothetical protein
MSFGLQVFTFVHVLLSLVGIGSGFVVMFGMLNARRMDGWTALFLTTTVATSVTGFFFPVEHFMPSHAIGIVSLLALAVAIAARYSFRLAGAWRWLYVVSALFAQYLDVFVLFFQGFLKVPFLKALAPTQAEPPFLVAQLVVLVLFLIFGFFAVKRFHVVSPSVGSEPA